MVRIITRRIYAGEDITEEWMDEFILIKDFKEVLKLCQN